MAPNVNSPWITVRQWNSPISLRNQKKEQELKLQNETIKKPQGSVSNGKDIRPFQPRANFDPIQRIDSELAKLREAPSKVSIF
jgi:hypothetical protein